MRTSTTILDTTSGYSANRWSSLSLAWNRHACPDYEISPRRDVNRNILQILTAVVLSVRFLIAFYKIGRSVADDFGVEVLIYILLINRHFHTICYAH